METGGYKNRSRELPKAELHALITERLGVPPENIICEYGMSELSSQAYDVAGDKWHVTANRGASRQLARRHSALFISRRGRGCKSFRRKPDAKSPRAKPGLIRVFDLANVFSVAAIQTEDLGIRRGDGFELLGRAQLAEPRGCSLMSHKSELKPRNTRITRKENSRIFLCFRVFRVFRG